MLCKPFLSKWKNPCSYFTMFFQQTTTAVCNGDDSNFNCANLHESVTDLCSGNILQPLCCDYCANLPTTTAAPTTTTTPGPTTSACFDLLSPSECDALVGANACDGAFASAQCCRSCLENTTPVVTTTTTPPVGVPFFCPLASSPCTSWSFRSLEYHNLGWNAISWDAVV